MINEEIKIEYNNSSLLNKKDGINAIVFILLVPDQNIVKIDCYYYRLDRQRIINHFNKYKCSSCYYIISISGDPRLMFTTSDIQFIQSKLGSNFIEMLNKKNSWILCGLREDMKINTIAELVDESSITYSFPIEIKSGKDCVEKCEEECVEKCEEDCEENVVEEENIKYPSYPLYDLKKHTFIKDEYLIANQFLFIGGNFFENNTTTEIDTINSPSELDIDNVKKYMAIILLSEEEEKIEKWNLCTIMQGVPVFSKFYKKGTIQFKNEKTLLNYLAKIREDPSVGHKIAYEMSKEYWGWNNLEWKRISNCFKSNIPLVEREYNIQYITIIDNISDLTDVLDVFWNQKINGNRSINVYTTQHLYSDLINIVNCNNIKLYLANNITLYNQIDKSADYLLYLDSRAKYTADYTKNILYNFDVAEQINIIGKGVVNYCFTYDIYLGSISCKINEKSINTFEKFIKGENSDEIYSVDPYEFSV